MIRGDAPQGGIFTGKTVSVETGDLDKLRGVLGIFDENLETVARELGLAWRVNGTSVQLEGEESACAVGAEVLGSLLAIIEAGEPIDKSSLLYCIELAREGKASEIGGIMKDVVAVTSRGK